MENLIKKTADYFNLPLHTAEEVTKDVIMDFNAVVERLDKYTKEGTDVVQVVQELEGFNLEHGTFDMEYNNLQLTIDCIGEDYNANMYSIANPIWIVATNADKYTEPLEVSLDELPLNV